MPTGADSEQSSTPLRTALPALAANQRRCDLQSTPPPSSKCARLRIRVLPRRARLQPGLADRLRVHSLVSVCSACSVGSASAVRTRAARARARSSERFHGQTWQRWQAAASLHKRLPREYLQGRPQLYGWPTDPMLSTWRSWSWWALPLGLSESAATSSAVVASGYDAHGCCTAGGNSGYGSGYSPDEPREVYLYSGEGVRILGQLMQSLLTSLPRGVLDNSSSESSHHDVLATLSENFRISGASSVFQS
mmetsp:Transcript_58487/g.133655  ORF Transcript_58487/g.133655 Transcript_58487/m.133655 type:complete len:250 (-) Transcript_58487:149-898(-)